MGDANAAAWFTLAPCTLCSTTGWAVKHNGIWKD
jgi:hypothetical protein